VAWWGQSFAEENESDKSFKKFSCSPIDSGGWGTRSCGVWNWRLNIFSVNMLNHDNPPHVLHELDDPSLHGADHCEILLASFASSDMLA